MVSIRFSCARPRRCSGRCTCPIPMRGNCPLSMSLNSAKKERQGHGGLGVGQAAAANGGFPPCHHRVAGKAQHKKPPSPAPPVGVLHGPAHVSGPGAYSPGENLRHPPIDSKESLVSAALSGQPEEFPVLVVHVDPEGRAQCASKPPFHHQLHGLLGPGKVGGEVVVLKWMSRKPRSSILNISSTTLPELLLLTEWPKILWLQYRQW